MGNSFEKIYSCAGVAPVTYRRFSQDTIWGNGDLLGWSAEYSSYRLVAITKLAQEGFDKLTKDQIGDFLACLFPGSLNHPGLIIKIRAGRTIISSSNVTTDGKETHFMASIVDNPDHNNICVEIDTTKISIDKIDEGAFYIP